MTCTMPDMSNTTKFRSGPLATLGEVATLLGKHPTTIYRAVKSGQFPFAVVDLGGRLYVPRVELQKLVSVGEPADRRCVNCGSPAR